MDDDADALIRHFGLAPHPEGGHFREIYRHEPTNGSRGRATSIYFLLKESEVSRWHRVDAEEIWHFYAGDPLLLSIANEGSIDTVTLGADYRRDQVPVGVVPAGCWQSAVSTGHWSLVGCTVAPAFSFEGFEMAPEGWSPDAGEIS